MKREARLERVGKLVSRLHDGVLDEDGREELNELLRGDPDACERYLDLSESHAALLHDHVADELSTGIRKLSGSRSGGSPSGGSRSGGSRSGSSRIVRPRFLGWQTVGFAAGILLLLHFGLAWWLRPESADEPVAGGEWVAVLSRTIDAVWGDGGAPAGEGDPLAAGRLRLRAGLAQIEFFSGATVIVEGPAELDLESAWLVHCREGKLQTFVPEPARGFTIETPEYRAVDLGTEFSLLVGEDGESELHVVDGEVRLDDKAGRMLHELTAGRGILARDGAFEKVARGGGGFVDRRALLGLAEADWRARHVRWESSRDRLLSDPATRVLFDFEGQDPWDRHLENRKTGGRDGAVIGARWTEGRWPGKGALEFKRITDRVRLRVPGAFEALTFAARVRVEGLDRWLSSLLLTDGFETGEVHWQLSDAGELVLGIANDGGGDPNTTSPPVLSPDDLGRWMHLAVTVDRTTGRVVHYLDGEPVVEDRREDLPALRIGDAEIGNWRSKGKNHPIRSFNGRIEEFVILDRALTSGEIRELAGETR